MVLARQAGSPKDYLRGGMMISLELDGPILPAAAP
jgi:hypothetical protein